MAMFERIDTVFLQVRDFEKAIQWYTETFGFSVRWRDDVNGYAALNVGETPLTLVRTAEGAELTKATHCMFNFFTADTQAAHRHLQEAGADVDPIGVDGTVTYFEFRDPDGNWLGVCSF